MVAKHAGVAQSTVSLVVNNSPRVSDFTRKKVLSAARELGYIMESQKRRLLIGLIITRMREIKSYQAMMISALKEEIYKRRYRMEIICNEDIPLLNDRIVSGAISISNDPKLNEHWQNLNTIPLVRIGGVGDHLSNIYTVYPDPESNITQMFEHLWGYGHRRIGLILKLSHEQEENILEHNGEVFRRLIFERGCDNPDDFISYADKRTIDKRLDDLLAQKVTALIVIPGDTGLVISRKLNLRGLRIPQDISLITLEYSGISENWNPPLTTFLRDYPAISKHALDLLEKLISPNATACDIPVSGYIIPRESVAKPII